MTEQQIQFSRSLGGTRIAFATTGAGTTLPSMVRSAHWLGSLDFDGQTPVWAPWIKALARRHRLTRYDCRGCGLSDRDVDDFSLDVLVADLESVVDAAGLKRFALLGMSQGGAVSIAYAARPPGTRKSPDTLRRLRTRHACEESKRCAARLVSGHDAARGAWLGSG